MGGNVSLQLAPSPKLKTAEVAFKDTPVSLDSHVLDDSVLGVENTLASVAFEGYDCCYWSCISPGSDACACVRSYARVWSGASAGVCVSALLILGLGPVFLSVHVLVSTLLGAEQTITRLARKPSREVNACYVNSHVPNSHGVIYVSTCVLVILFLHVDRIMLHVGQSRQ